MAQVSKREEVMSKDEFFAYVANYMGEGDTLKCDYDGTFTLYGATIGSGNGCILCKWNEDDGVLYCF